MTDPIIHTQFSLGTDLTALEDLETALEALSKDAHLAPRDHFQIRLALDELVTNSVSYGFSSGFGSEITIKIALYQDNRCEIEYADDAPAFDILTNPVPEEKRGTEEANYGGLGISLVTKVMNEVSYCYKNGKNIIRMKKELTAQEDQ